MRSYDTKKYRYIYFIFLYKMSEGILLSSLLVILLTLFVILTERKLLAFAQRRMGPTIMGRNGAFQIVADLFKMLTKEIFIIPKPSTTLAPIFIVIIHCSATILLELCLGTEFITNRFSWLYDTIPLSTHIII